MVDPAGKTLSGQRGLVTGATSGLGRAIALRLAADGAHVLVHGRDQARGAASVAEIIAAGGNASFIAADLGSADEVLRLAREAGAIDLLVNNAGSSAASSASTRARASGARRTVASRFSGNIGAGSACCH